MDATAATGTSLSTCVASCPAATRAVVVVTATATAIATSARAIVVTVVIAVGVTVVGAIARGSTALFSFFYRNFRKSYYCLGLQFLQCKCPQCGAKYWKIMSEDGNNNCYNCLYF